MISLFVASLNCAFATRPRTVRNESVFRYNSAKSSAIKSIIFKFNASEAVADTDFLTACSAQTEFRFRFSAIEIR